MTTAKLMWTVQNHFPNATQWEFVSVKVDLGRTWIRVLCAVFQLVTSAQVAEIQFLTVKEFQQNVSVIINQLAREALSVSYMGMEQWPPVVIVVVLSIFLVKRLKGVQWAMKSLKLSVSTKKEKDTFTKADFITVKFVAQDLVSILQFC